MDILSFGKEPLAVAVLFLGAAIGCPAAAQTSDTTCYRAGQFLNCNTTTQQRAAGVPDYLGAMGVLPDPNAFMEGQQQAQQLRQQRLKNQAEEQQLAEQRQLDEERATQAAEAIRYSAAQAENRRQVIGRVMAGDCAGAINLALSAGDMDFAIKTKTFCASGDAPRGGK